MSTGTNFVAIAGDSPSFLNDPATDANPPDPPGREPWTLERPGRPEDAEGADLIRLSMPGTVSATLPKSVGLNRLLASPNSAPAPPLACVGVMESAYVNCPTSSGLAVFAASCGPSPARAICAKRTSRPVARMTLAAFVLLFMFSSVSGVPARATL